MIDVDAPTAIDVHAHVEVSAETGHGSLSPELEQAANAYFGLGDTGRPDIHQMADYYQQRAMAILAHPSFPWQDEALAVATHKPRVHIDLSGWSPKYFPPQLVRYANSLLADKVLFGSDFPMITPDRWLRDFDALDIKPEVRPKILKHYAARLLGLTSGG